MTEGGGGGEERARVAGREVMVGRVMREEPVGLDNGKGAPLFFAKQIRHFPPKNGFCSFSRHLPHSANKYG